MRIRLGLWLGLVTLMIAAAYYGRATEGKPDPNTLYEYRTFELTIGNYAVILLIVLAIASFRRDLLALRRPRWSVRRTLAMIAAVVIGIYVAEGIYATLVHLGNEQGLTPSRWQPKHATEYVVNGVALCTVVPFVEELTYRGLGFTLLAPFGKWFAIVAVGVVFGLAHGLVLSLPVLAAFGAAAAWLRAQSDSVFPGMALHAIFNGIALVSAVALRH